MMTKLLIYLNAYHAYNNFTDSCRAMLVIEVAVLRGLAALPKFVFHAFLTATSLLSSDSAPSDCLYLDVSFAFRICSYSQNRSSVVPAISSLSLIRSGKVRSPWRLNRSILRLHSWWPFSQPTTFS